MAHPNRIAYYRGHCAPPLTQGELARLLAVHPNTVQNWERGGIARPDALLRIVRVFVERGALSTYHEARAFWEETARAGCSPPPELRLLFARAPAGGEPRALQLPLGEPPAPGALAAGSLPHFPNPRFAGRDADLRVLAALLRHEGAVAAVCGIGGLGKTQLAVEFAHRYGPLFPGGVCWINAAEPSAIAGQVAAWGGQLPLPHVAQLSFERRLALAQQAWREPTARLLVFDNCESPTTLFEWLPPRGGCRAVITSRTRAWSAYGHIATLDLGPLARHASLDLLGAGRPHAAPALPQLDAIAALLGDLPLALHLASKHLMRTGDPAAYLAQLQGRRPLRHASFQVHAPSPTAYAWRPEEIVHHMCSQLADRDEGAWGRAALAALRYLAPGAPVPLDFLGAALADGGLTPSQFAVARAHLIDDVGLVESLRGGVELRVHPVVHAYLAAAPDDPVAYRGVVRAALAQAAATTATGTAIPEPIIRHMRSVADEALARGRTEAGELCAALAWPLAISAQYRAARDYARHAVALAEGEAGPRLAAALNVLALIDQITGDFAAAEAAYLRARHLWEQAAGPDSVDVATVCNNLGFLALLRGRYADADESLRRALALRRARAGLRDPSTARIIHNLGYLALRRGLRRAAERYLRLALALRRELLPGPSLATAFTLALLAEARLEAGDLDAAEAYAQEALAMRRAAGGPAHDDVGSSYAQLGSIRQASRDLAGAVELVGRALTMREAALGPDAPETLADLTAIGELYAAQGRAAEAQTALDRAIRGLAVAGGAGSPVLARAVALRARLGREALTRASGR